MPFRAPFLLPTLFVGVLVVACGTNTTTVVQGPSCDPTVCAPGNKCLPLNGETKCRKTCASNVDPATSCPFGYTCVDTLTGVEPFCIKDNNDVKPSAKGIWGAPCNAAQGFDNPACDSAQGFLCYGLSPTDGNAYCTRYEC